MLFYRRHNVQRTSRQVSLKRYSELKDYSFLDIVFIATFGSAVDIPKYTPSLVQASRIHCREFTFFEFWQKYCKALQGHERTSATYEGAIHLAAEGLPKNEIECWHEQHQNNLLRLQQIAKQSTCQEGTIPQAAVTPTQSLCPAESVTERPAKRRRTEQIDVQFPSPSLPNEVFPMRLPARDKLPTILSKDLFEGLQTSQVWLQEHSHLLTETVCLFWPPERAMDFFLELIVSEPASTAVSEAISQSNSATRKVLGDFLYRGMIESECIKNGGET